CPISLFILEEVLQGFEKWQIGFGPCEALRAAPMRNNAGTTGSRKFAEEVLDQSRLADAGFAGHTHKQPLARLGLFEGSPQPCEFFLATDGMALDCSRRWLRRRLGSRPAHGCRNRHS